MGKESDVAIVWGVVLVVLSAVCWGGQAVSWFSPATAMRLSLTEAEAEVEPAFAADGRGEAVWDTLTLWVTIVAGVLLIGGNAAWPYFGLAGGAVYVYFAGRGLLTRKAMQQRGLRIGTAQNVATAYVALTTWGVTGLVTMISAAVSLSA
jgi:hypothetical protein